MSLLGHVKADWLNEPVGVGVGVGEGEGEGEGLTEFGTFDEPPPQADRASDSIKLRASRTRAECGMILRSGTLPTGRGYTTSL
ncbi:MAG: hypothetical protein WAN59_07925 [Candidatus Baltobacteraceae bacterium]